MNYREWRRAYGSGNSSRDFRAWLAQFGLSFPTRGIRLDFAGIDFGCIAMSSATERIEVNPLTPETYREAVARLR
jgi:hypothetical protein